MNTTYNEPLHKRNIIGKLHRTVLDLVQWDVDGSGRYNTILRAIQLLAFRNYPEFTKEEIENALYAYILLLAPAKQRQLKRSIEYFIMCRDSRKVALSDKGETNA